MISAAVCASGGLNDKDQLELDTNTAADDELPTGLQPLEDMVDWLFDELESQCLLYPGDTKPKESAFAVKNEDILNKIRTSEAEVQANKVWFDNHAPYGQAGIGAGTDLEEVDATDSELDGGGWEWDDEWDSAEPIPATECDEELGLFATSWV